MYKKIFKIDKMAFEPILIENICSTNLLERKFAMYFLKAIHPNQIFLKKFNTKSQDLQKNRGRRT